MIDEDSQQALHVLKRNGLLRGVEIAKDNWINPRHVAQMIVTHPSMWRVTFYYTFAAVEGQGYDPMDYATEAEAQSIVDQIRAAW